MVSKPRIIITVLLLIGFIVAFFLPWVVISATGTAYSGWAIKTFVVQRYAALGLGLLSFVLIAFPKRMFYGVSCAAALIALSSVGCFLHLIHKAFLTGDNFAYGFYIFVAILLIQVLNAACGLCCCQKCCGDKKQPCDGKQQPCESKQQPSDGKQQVCEAKDQKLDGEDLQKGQTPSTPAQPKGPSVKKQ